MEKIVGDIKYRLTSDGWVVESCYDNDILEADIPSHIDGQPVVQIENKAFQDCQSLEAVWIPETITDVENYAFADCINLRSFQSESKELTLGSGVFLNCRKLKVFKTAGKVFVGSRAFANCLLLSEFIGIIDGLLDRAFVKCHSLKNTLYFDETLYHFYATAFADCAVRVLHFNGNIPEITGVTKGDLGQFTWIGKANSNLMELAYSGFHVTVEE